MSVYLPVCLLVCWFVCLFVNLLFVLVLCQARDLRISRITSTAALQQAWFLLAPQFPGWSHAQREAAMSATASNYAQEFEVRG